LSTLVFKTGRRTNINLTATSWGAEAENLFDEGIVIFEDSRGGHTVGGRESSVNQRVDLKSNLPSAQNVLRAARVKGGWKKPLVKFSPG
jgi:hypothetical protein